MINPLIPGLVLKLILYNTDYKLYQLALTIPIRSVKCERSISALRRVHSYNRSTVSIKAFKFIYINY